jgi:hypothetical protein
MELDDVHTVKESVLPVRARECDVIEGVIDGLYEKSLLEA